MFVLADDLSSDLVPYMRQVQALQRQGTSFDRYVVTDSLCCPSRASIFTGRYPHSTGVIRNQPPDGGWPVFHAVAEKSTFATSLARVGYRTALMGKYMNGYAPADRFIPPGWTDWAVAGEAYKAFNYNLLTRNGRRVARPQGRGLPDRRDLGQGPGVHQRGGTAPAAVHARARAVRAA